MSVYGFALGIYAYCGFLYYVAHVGGLNPPENSAGEPLSGDALRVWRLLRCAAWAIFAAFALLRYLGRLPRLVLSVTRSMARLPRGAFQYARWRLGGKSTLPRARTVR